MSGKIYRDIQLQENSFFRVFELNELDDDELHWHRDHNDREVYVVCGKGWKFQKENKMPIELIEGDVININKMDYHRLIKGKTNLILKIVEEI
jgi:quercetin dioxygenase-like cupin family protein